MSKYHYAKGFFCKYVRQWGGKLETDLNPNMHFAELTITSPVIHFYSTDLKRFNNIIKFSSAITFDATADGQVCISLNIPDVFIENVKNNQ